MEDLHQAMQLTMEQSFSLAKIKADTEKITLEQAQKYLPELTRQLMIKDNLIKHFMKKQT